MTENEWIIPIEIVKIWQHVKFYTGDDVQETADNLKNSILTDNKTEQKQIRNAIKIFIRNEEKKITT